MKIFHFSSGQAPEIRTLAQNSKAPEGWRTPKRFARNGHTAQRASVLECGGLPPLFHGAAVAVLILFLAPGATAQTTNALSDKEIQGCQLAQKLLDQWPTENFTNTGVLQIRDSAGNRTNFPINFEVAVTKTNWKCFYTAHPTNVCNEVLLVTHANDAPNVYSYVLASEFSVDSLPNSQSEPFVNSDFWLGDLGLEFLHWPDQKILRGDTARGRLCKILESTNPDPSPNGYSRVDSWIDNETLGIVEAKAYDFHGKLLKEFYPKDIKKVDGQWQVGSMEIDNVQTGSRTRLKLDLKAK
jgi:hypothetical protein